MMRSGSGPSPRRVVAIAFLCLAFAAGASTAKEDEPADPSPVAPVAPVARGDAAPPDPPRAAPPAGASEPARPAAPSSAPPAHPSKEPHRESAAGGKRRFFRTPAGAITLAILGAVLVGSIAQSSFGDRTAPSH